jgi:hypothetical protein
MQSLRDLHTKKQYSVSLGFTHKKQASECSEIWTSMKDSGIVEALLIASVQWEGGGGWTPPVLETFIWINPKPDGYIN